MPTTFQTKCKYEKEHSGFYNRSYQQQNQGLKLLEHWQDEVQLCGPVLDIGCGNGKLCRWLAKRGLDVTGIDIVNGPYDRNEYSFMEMDVTQGRWPFDSCQFQLGLCFDVLEHLEQEDIPHVVNETMRTCVQRLVIVPHTGAPRNLHLTVQPPDWWESVFCDWIKVRTFDRTPGRPNTVFKSYKR
jgi:2-polyprenyl-3-methyl-5-hydroxy-6-metoxy-1,4-benzoquinol methylase